MMKAVIQLGYVIFGTGRTDKEAISDAGQWIDDPDWQNDLVPLAEAGYGSLILIECTPALATAVKERGGDIPFALDGQVADLAE